MNTELTKVLQAPVFYKNKTNMIKQFCDKANVFTMVLNFVIFDHTRIFDPL